jgi:cytochrome c556
MTANRTRCLLAFAILATPLLAAPQDVVATRTAGYRALGAAFKSVNDQLRSGAPQGAVLKDAAGKIQVAARAQYGWFPAGSGPAPGLKTAAKPEIWTQPAQFKAAQDAFTTQSAVFARAVAGGDVATITAASKQLGAACGGCHRSFRSDAKG